MRGDSFDEPRIPRLCLERLKALGLDPFTALAVPREVRHHERVEPGRDAWRHTHTSYDMPLAAEARRAWSGPERFKRHDAYAASLRPSLGCFP